VSNSTKSLADYFAIEISVDGKASTNPFWHCQVDKQTPLMGYMPNHLPWALGERLNNLGTTILNKKITGACHVDRKLVSGDSPLAANGFGKIAATCLLNEINKRN